MTRELVTQMLNALDYHQSQTRPIHNTELAIEAAREYLATEPTVERAELIADLRDLAPRLLNGRMVATAADMLEADAGLKTEPGVAQEFYRHEVEEASDWSEWVCPRPEKYLMKCCDCGLVHEMQFKVVKYSEDDECEHVNDPDTQAVFRARRVEAQPKDKGPWCAGVTRQDARVYVQSDDFKHDVRLYVTGDFATVDEKYLYACEVARQLTAAAETMTADAQQAKRVPMTDDAIADIWIIAREANDFPEVFARAIEAHHGIHATK